MNKLVATIFFMSLFASAYSNAEEKYDIQCTLDSGDVMTLSHNNTTAYIEFLAPDDDPDEGGSVIKLDIPSGGAQQFLDNSSEAKQSFVLRGTDDDIEGAVAIGYENHEGKLDAYFSAMNSLGKETQRYTCKPETIRAAQSLLTNGIGIKVPSPKNQAEVAGAKTTDTATGSPFKISVSERLFQYGTIKTPYRTVNIVSTSDDLVINAVTVNRNQCSDSIGNPKQAFNLPFGQTVTYDYNIQYKRCDVVEVVVKTNKQDWTFRP
ncbi:hypothetical protein J3D47_003668 [Pseudomonas laurylsulfativorans]|uniref:hypothetical protein n=1 Tax=Pseudomonas laurylsulfativorans TaxID=1943631 RepID=UPI00209D8658|nr:hypothetical protein [Pseudomonas laurylsulfativorans]MCP1419425.1 hypothetical protein [Pseudomonas laurylsulfativorans]